MLTVIHEVSVLLSWKAELLVSCLDTELGCEALLLSRTLEIICLEIGEEVVLRVDASSLRLLDQLLLLLQLVLLAQEVLLPVLGLGLVLHLLELLAVL
jgi:hypothetical protein